MNPTSAWIVEDRRSIVPSFSPEFGLCLIGSPPLFEAPSESDWVIAFDQDRRLARIGTILRKHIAQDKTTLWFERMQLVTEVIDIAGLGLAPPSGGLARLPWDDLIRIVGLLGFESPDGVPLVQDVAYIRDLLELAVRDDLLGPAMGPTELVKDMSVRDRYLVGKLAPLKRDADAAPVEPAGDLGADTELEDERVAPIHEPGAEFNRAGGRVESGDDGLDEIDTGNNQSLVPSSMGMTFCVMAGVSKMEAEIRWGRYERLPNDEHEFVKNRHNRHTGADELVKVKVWRRVPCGGCVPLDIGKDGPIHPAIPDADRPDVRLQGSVHTNAKGERLVTLFLVNGQEEPKDNVDRAWLFQPEIVVRAAKESGDKAIFRHRPTNDAVVNDEERDRLALLYRDHVEFAVGHGVAVHAEVSLSDPTRAIEIGTVVIPRQEIPVTETPGFDTRDRSAMRKMVERGWLDMRRLSEIDTAELREALETLDTDYSAWIAEQRARIDGEMPGFVEPANGAMALCDETGRRLHEGIGVVLCDERALEAFRAANRAMALQRTRGIYALRRRRGEDIDLSAVDIPDNRSWRPFQLAFLLLSIPSLADPMHPDRTNPVAAYADLLWFPTGGGKTEAYLGVAAFAMFIRRLQKNLAGLDGSRGLAVIMRYTLRLLTLQQFQRASTLVCAMETIRREKPGEWGQAPFTLGLWVGNRVTPGSVEDSHRAIETIRDNDRNRAGLASPAQLTTCPWCGSEISARRDIEVDKTAGRTTIYCGDSHQSCAFSKARSRDATHPGLPVVVVDEEIYHRPPSMLIATVDKFAMMSWLPEVRTLFGRVHFECARHGLLWPGHECGTGHKRRGSYPPVTVGPIPAIRPPDLVIQDEFHLISGPLGTMVGIYETAVDDLCSWNVEGRKVRPKIVASTATVRRATDQVRNVFMRRVAVFPPSGLDVSDNFFSVQRPVKERPGRRYLGICAPGSSRPAVLIRTYTAFMTAAQGLFQRFGPVADPYMTLVGYFNSLRELGGMKRLAEDDVKTRSYRVKMSLIDRPGLAQRSLGDVYELTSRVSSQDIPKYLDRLEVRYDGAFDQGQGKWSTKWEEGNRPMDIVLATNMLSVGVDVNRLGTMVVNGQPKGTAEYIQATSRVGRAYPGLVASVLTWARPRDLSHYETFEHYHATFYSHVKAQSVTPFSPRAMDRGLTGTMIAEIRHAYEDLSRNDDAGRMDRSSRDEMRSTIDSIVERVWDVTEDSEKKELARRELAHRADEWAHEATMGGRTLVYRRWGSGPTSYPLLEEPGTKPWSRWTVPTSMREVEPGVRLVMEDDRSTYDPAWRAQPRDDGEERV